MTSSFDPFEKKKNSCQSNQPDLVCGTGQRYSDVLLARKIFTLFFSHYFAHCIQ